MSLAKNAFLLRSPHIASTQRTLSTFCSALLGRLIYTTPKEIHLC